jgi:hypothetical protein
MANKKVFVLRLDPAVYNAVEKWASENFRSVNGQMEWIIEKMLKKSGKNPKKKKPETRQE